MKIAIITNIPSPYRVDLFNYISKTIEDEVYVVYTSKNEDNRKWDKDIHINHNHIFLESKTIKIKKKSDYKYIHIPVNILFELNKINPDVVIASEYNPTALLSFKWSRFKHKKYISWSDGTLNSEKNINFIQKRIRKTICKKANAFIASSTKTKEAQIYYGANEKKIFISYLTVDIKKYLNEKERKVKGNNLIYVGRLTEQKGLNLLFKALKDVKSDYKLNIVGNGPEESNLKKLSQELNLSENINFCGLKNQKEIKEYYEKSDIFILPTKQDCFGLVITEAMCSGLPVVVSKYADGAYDLIEEGKNGFIVDPYNAEEFKEKIENLLLNYDKKTNMGKEALKKVKNFSIENVSKNFIKAIYI